MRSEASVIVEGMRWTATVDGRKAMHGTIRADAGRWIVTVSKRAGSELSWATESPAMAVLLTLGATLSGEW